MHQVTEKYDVVVCGGGLAGFTAAVSAARLGQTVCLVQDRPVLGGNSSSEVRVVPRGSTTYHAYAREGGVLAEVMAKERHRNHEPIFENGWANSIWDLTMYDLALRTPGLTLRMNTAVHDVEVADAAIKAVTGWTSSAETQTRFEGSVFLDCTGDGVVAALAGCKYRSGEEAREEFGEPHAPLQASPDTMGNSLHFKTVDVGRDVDFELPDWAVEYTDPDFFYAQGRVPYDLRGGFWWIELGKPWDTIRDAEVLRHELTRRTLGVWDWMKNKDPRTREKARTLALDWIGQVPGKRESRRIMGLHLLTEGDLTRTEPFEDEIAYGGWNIDLHTPGGMLAGSSEPTAAEGYDLHGAASSAAYVGPFGIPLRSLIARDVTNLLMAGRNVSATHVALGSVRVQATTAIMGQAAGTAAAVALERGIAVHDLPGLGIGDIQQQLLRDGCFLPNVANCDPNDLARAAEVTASSEARYHGATPGDTWVDGGLDERSRNVSDVLTAHRAQWIPVETGTRAPGVAVIHLLLVNDSDKAEQVRASLHRAEHIWDYRVNTGQVLESTTLGIEPGEHWVPWPVHVPGGTLQEGSGYLRVDLEPNPAVQWRRAGRVVPGAVSAFEMTPGRMRRFGDGVTMSHRVEPAQRAYPATAVTTGVARPHRATNLWRSDPGHPAEAWIELAWPQEQQLATVQLTFAGHLLREYDRTPPLWSDPQTLRDYVVQVRQGGVWQEVCSVSGNVLPRRHHALGITGDALRVQARATNGDPSVAIYEIRVGGRGGG